MKSKPTSKYPVEAQPVGLGDKTRERTITALCGLLNELECEFSDLCARLEEHYTRITGDDPASNITAKVEMPVTGELPWAFCYAERLMQLRDRLAVTISNIGSI